MNRPVSLACFGIFLLGIFVCSAQETPQKRKPLSEPMWSKILPGDIVFIRSRTANAPLIAALSNVDAANDADDVFTHCGIVFKDTDGELKVYEGEGRGPGLWLTLGEWQKKVSTGKVNGVAKDDRHNIYVLRWNGTPGLAAGLGKLLEKAKALHDTEYDHGFSWSDKRAYCSELIWKAFDAGGLKLGELPKMKKYVDGAPPEIAKQIKGKLNDAKVEFRNGEGYLPEESAVSPEDIFKSSVLTPVTDDSP
ncbi:MAG: YiiX/YebB-like N1pC/P60 family cysteine hydrolase [Chthoniobacterales bacterium]